MTDKNFKVGWVYEDKTGKRVLIYENSNASSNIYGVCLEEKECYYYSKKGIFISVEHVFNLIHSTGKKWEPEE